MKKNKSCKKIIILALIASLMFTGCGNENTDMEPVNYGTIEEDSSLETTETTIIDDSGEETTISDIAYDSIETTVSTLDFADTTESSVESQTSMTIVSETDITSETESLGSEPSGFMGGIETTEETTVAQVEEEVEERIPAIYTPDSDCLNAEITTSYAYRDLNEKDRALYDAIIAAAKVCGQVNFSHDDYSEEDWIRIFCAAYYNEPQLFWIDSILDYGTISYRTTDLNEINNMQAQIDSALTNVINNLNAYPKTVDKIKYIHDYIITNCDFEKEQGYNQSIYGGLVSHKVQCEGYSKTFLYICNKVGIQSMVVSGTVDTGLSHAWNIVYLDGEWYNIDLTHDDPILDTPNSKYIRYTYFLVPDSDIINQSHFDVNLSMTYQRLHLYNQPHCYGDKYNYFKYYDKIYSDFNSANDALKSKLVEASKNQIPMIQIRVDSENVYAQLKDTNNLLAIKDYIEKNAQTPVKDVSAHYVDNMYILGIILKY